MGEIVRFLRLEAGQTEVLPLWELFFALGVTVFCTLIIGAVYRYTHSSPGYSQSYVQTLVLTAMVTTVIMVVIGSNLARAFSLIGALSIIRFRNAVKETRDVGYIFFGLAVAMAAGTRFYSIALGATGAICATMVVLHSLGYGRSDEAPERLLKIRLPAGEDPLVVLEDTFKQLFTGYSLVLLESARQGLFLNAVFSVRQAEGVSAAQVVEKLTAANENLKVTYHVDLHGQEP